MLSERDWTPAGLPLAREEYKDINHPLGNFRQQGLILERLGPTKSRQQDSLFWPESIPQPTPLLPLSNVQYMPIIQEGSIVGRVAYVASVSN